MTHRRPRAHLFFLSFLLGLAPVAFAQQAAGGNWTKTVEVDPAGTKTEKEFLDHLGKQGLATKGYVNWYTGRWPYISFIGGMAMGNDSEDLEFFYEAGKPFKWWTHVLDYVMQDGGTRYGIRAHLHRYKRQGKVGGHRSFLLTVRTDTLLKDYHPSYILANGLRIWDSKTHPFQEGKIVVPFYQEEDSDLVIDFVTDKQYTPEVKGLAFRMFFVQFLGDPGTKAFLKGAPDKKEASPADSEERFAFGVFPSGYDFNTEQGPKLADLRKTWKKNFRPDYPVDEVWLAPSVFLTPGKGEYHDFMMTYGGCNVAAAEAPESLLKDGQAYLRGVLMKPRDAKAAKALLDAHPTLQAHWMEGEGGILVAHGGGSDADLLKSLAANAKAIADAKAATGAPDRVRHLFEPCPVTLTSALEYQRGSDILILKNEEDPQYNIMMAMSRGAGRSFGKPFGFYWEQTHYPFIGVDHKLQACLLYYLSGGSWIGAEAEGAPGFTWGVVPDWVLPYVQALRFAMVHPARGKVVVPIGVLWTYGDRWWAPYNSFALMDMFQRHAEYDHATKTLRCEPSFIKPFDWMPKDRATWNFQNSGHLGYFIDNVDEMKGYDMLDVFWPQFGDAFTARIARLMTGTPYGPVDFVYGDAADAEHLKSFGLIAILGHATMSQPLEAKLRAALDAGVPVVMGAQHCRADDKTWARPFGLEIVEKDLAAVQGDIDKATARWGGKFSGKVYGFKGEGWRTEVTAGGRPLVITRKVGNADVYVYLGQWIHEGGAALRPILSKLAAQAAPLALSPADDTIEYVPYRKGAGAWAAVFNHGNITVGCDRLKESRITPPEPLSSKPKGPWKGRIGFRLQQAGLDPKGEYVVYQVDGIDGKAFDDVISGNKTFQIRALDSQTKDGVVSADVEVVKRGEFVVAPKGQGEAVFFGK